MKAMFEMERDKLNSFGPVRGDMIKL